MIAPVVLFALSVVGVAAALWLPGGQDYLLIPGSCALASLYLLLRALARRLKVRRPGKAPVIIDGSNVMHWLGDRPQIEPVLDVVDELNRRGFAPGVVFDANVGYKLLGRYQHDGAMAKLLRLPRDNVRVVDKGAVADQFILEAARALNARVVTNDRYRDWADAHPEVTAPGYLIRGGYRDGKLWLGLEAG